MKTKSRHIYLFHLYHKARLGTVGFIRCNTGPAPQLLNVLEVVNV